MKSTYFWSMALVTALSTGAFAMDRERWDRETYRMPQSAWQAGEWRGYLRCDEAPHDSAHQESHPCALKLVSSDGKSSAVEPSQNVLSVHKSSPWSVPVVVRGARAPEYLFGTPGLRVDSVAVVNVSPTENF